MRPWSSSQDRKAAKLLVTSTYHYPLYMKYQSHHHNPVVGTECPGHPSLRQTQNHEGATNDAQNDARYGDGIDFVLVVDIDRRWKEIR